MKIENSSLYRKQSSEDRKINKQVIPLSNTGSKEWASEISEEEEYLKPVSSRNSASEHGKLEIHNFKNSKNTRLQTPEYTTSQPMINHRKDDSLDDSAEIDNIQFKQNAERNDLSIVIKKNDLEIRDSTDTRFKSSHRLGQKPDNKDVSKIQSKTYSNAMINQIDDGNQYWAENQLRTNNSFVNSEIHNVVFQKLKICHHCGAKEIRSELNDSSRKQEESVEIRPLLGRNVESVGVQVGRPHYIDAKSRHILRNKANFGYLKERIDNTINKDCWIHLRNPYTRNNELSYSK